MMKSEKGYVIIATLLPHESREHLQDPNIHAFSSDVTKDVDASTLKKEIEQITNGRLDVLVNNAYGAHP